MTVDNRTSTVWEGKLISNWQPGSGEPITVTSPGTGKVLGTVAAATSKNLDLAVDTARASQRAWAAASYSIVRA